MSFAAGTPPAGAAIARFERSGGPLAGDDPYSPICPALIRPTESLY